MLMKKVIDRYIFGVPLDKSIHVYPKALGIHEWFFGGQTLYSAGQFSLYNGELFEIRNENSVILNDGPDAIYSAGQIFDLLYENNVHFNKDFRLRYEVDSESFRFSEELFKDVWSSVKDGRSPREPIK